VYSKGLSTPGNKVAENGNKLLPETATLCRKRQQSVAVSGNNVAFFGDYSFGLNAQLYFCVVNGEGCRARYVVRQISP